MQPALQEITNRLNQVNNILVTVKANPTVDELSAALGLTMALNNYGKHATAVFSGQIPNAMSFLKPQKTFENNVHSLRDFIISLNKEKADKLRFAKDGEIVKIYITPYKSTITPNDLEYSEGDFNVEMVIAVGINVKEELDTVIAAHGRILHEATVATVMAGPAPSQLGSINWNDPLLTSASAMSLQLIQSLNNPALMSPEVSTALLTGIVADTDRFSNGNTSPRVMELSAQLMNSGADHQLVTSSIGTGSHPIAAGSTIVQPVSPEPNQDLVLDLHSPAPALNPVAATNTAPMVNTPPETVNPQDLVLQPSEQPIPNTAPTINPTPPLSEPIAQLLPQPVDPTQTVVPANLMPPTPDSAQTIPNPTTDPIPAPALTQAQTVVQSTPQPFIPQPVALATEPAIPTTIPSQEMPAPLEQDKIKSEIDKIYSAEPFNPANNPRQDISTEIVIPTEDNIQALGAPAISVDTSVQSSQALDSTLKPIEATKDEAVNANDVLGNSSDTSGPGSSTTSVAAIPGLEMPPEITPPPQPPNPLALQRSSSIDTEPFGNTINFDPTKSAENATK